MKSLADIEAALEGPALDILEEEPVRGPVPSALTPEEIEAEVEASRERLPEAMALRIGKLRRQNRRLRNRIRRLERIVGCLGAPFRPEDEIEDDDDEGEGGAE